MAYQRQDFILDAIRSVLDSTVNRSAYEITLVVDKIEAGLAARVQALGVEILRVDSVHGGEMWIAGLRAARGDVISFLDDDDCFYPEKLSKVIEVFEDPNLTWYHNGFRRVDKERRPLSTVSPTRWGTRTFQAPLSRADLGRIRRMGGFYNNSCHSVRRNAVMKNLDGFLEVTFGQDFAIPALLSGPGKVIIDLPNVLTEFRTHWSQGSQPYAGSRMPDSHLRFLRGIVRTFYWLAREAPSPGARTFCQCRAESYETLVWTTRGESIGDAQSALPRALRAIQGNLEERDLFHATILALLMLSVPFSRRFTEAVYTALKRVEMRGFGLELPG